MNYYIGVKQVQAEPQVRDGREGYRVVYPDGYESWSPKETFEEAYMQQGEDPTRIDPVMVRRFQSGCDEAARMGNHTVLRSTLASGFSIVKDSACVDAANYDQDVGTGNALKKVESEVWAYLGFVLAWARNGLDR